MFQHPMLHLIQTSRVYYDNNHIAFRARSVALPDDLFTFIKKVLYIVFNKICANYCHHT